MRLPSPSILLRLLAPVVLGLGAVVTSAMPCQSGVSDPLIKRLFSADHPRREEAREELGKLDDEARKKLVPALVEVLRHGEGDDRSTAAMALAKIGPPAKDAVVAQSLDERGNGILRGRSQLS